MGDRDITLGPASVSVFLLGRVGWGGGGELGVGVAPGSVGASHYHGNAST